MDYVNNDDKTDSKIYDDLHNELEYISNDSKTEEKLYVSGINCSVENAYNEMNDTKRFFNKKDGIIAWHSFQSFKEGEVTPELAHEIGVKLAQNIWGDRFQVLVATHLNTNHIHNHFIINSVSFVDGKKYYANRQTYAELRKENDRICKENGLSYLDEKKTRKGIEYKYYQKEEYMNYYKQTKLDIDECISHSNNYDDFIYKLKNKNYDVVIRSNKLSVRNLNYKRNIRIERKFGSAYTIENIKKQIAGTYISETINNFVKYKRDKTLDYLYKTNNKSLAYTYIKYLKLLNKYPKYSKNNKLSYQVKKDLEIMDSINRQTLLLINNKIECEDDLHSFYLKLRDNLKNNSSNKEQIKDQIELCNEIMKRHKSITDEVEKIEKEVIIR